MHQATFEGLLGTELVKRRKAQTEQGFLIVSDEMDAPKYGVMRQTEIATNQLIRSVRYAV